ncbi:hypothetical protein [uncultured Dysosmobacter sp.]|uniref:hypothetical protein n=1 Tax=uncultured Dysosmobacter sp. TaxID=2591384 RepID=UPI002611A04B|nr:hypothetical protein [uncultured Dysosmobacter sp.]
MRRMVPVLLFLCLLAGCGTAPSPVETVSPVYTDWSKLVPREENGPLYTYFEPYSGTGPLQPREDYGPLLPYMGVLFQDYYPLYGLVTTDGQLVTEPVYCYIRTIDGSSGTSKFLLLSSVEGDPAWFSDNGSVPIWAENCVSVTAAAPDGSWVVSGDYRAAEQVDDRHLALYREDSSITILDDTGSVSAFFPGDTLVQWMGCGFWFWDDAGSPIVVWRDGFGALYDGIDDALIGWLDSSTGTISKEAPPGASAEGQEDVSAELPVIDGYRDLYPITDSVTGEVFLLGHRKTDGRWRYDLLDAQGHLLYPDWHSADYGIAGGLISTLEGDIYAYISLDTGEAAFRYPLRTNSD